jgi:multifunctional beta-oxidation protein
MTTPPNKQSESPVRFDGQTVIVTGAGAGLGKAYALMYGKLGANVVVNDVSDKAASSVVSEVQNGLYPWFYGFLLDLTVWNTAGGKAVAAIASVEDAELIVKTALDKFGSVHALIANAGILRDKSFTAMTEQEWDIVMAVHLR